MRDDALSIIVCGASAASGITTYLTWMRQEIDLSLRVLLTSSAERFVPRHVIAWHADESYASDDPTLNPTEFARRSAAIVVLPATANMLASAALGLAATPAQTVLLASDRPVMFFPSTNPSVWAKEITRRHVAELRAAGHTVVEPVEQVAYEIWRHENAVVPVMPPPDAAAEAIAGWLEKNLSDEP